MRSLLEGSCCPDRFKSSRDRLKIRWALLLFIGCCLVVLPAVAHAASVLNVDLISPDQEQAKPASMEVNSYQSSYLREVKKLSKQDKNSSLSAQQRYASIYRIIQDNQSKTTNFLNQSGLLKISPFEADNQDSLGKNDVVLDDIKTSLKDLNAQWNSIESSLNQYLEDAGIISSSSALATDQTDLLAYINQRSPSIDSQIDNLAIIKDSQELALEPPLEEQPVMNRLLFFISIPHLLHLLSDNLGSLIAVLMVWLFIKGTIQFLLWKMHNRKRRRIKRNRTIDGIRKF
ncbi:MAG: hypothetical protein HOP23_05575 [Methylococcaceae bacterium]|nr:hypothetical protein [Methylococcaceae bacterium]